MRIFVFHLLWVALIAAMMQNDEVVWASHAFKLFLANELDIETEVLLVSTKTDSHSEEEMKEREISCSIPAKGTIQILLGEDDRMVSGTFTIKLPNKAYKQKQVLYLQGDSGNNKTLTVVASGVRIKGRVSKWLTSNSPEMDSHQKSEGSFFEGLLTYVFPYNKPAFLLFLCASSSSSMQAKEEDATPGSFFASSQPPLFHPNLHSNHLIPNPNQAMPLLPYLHSNAPLSHLHNIQYPPNAVVNNGPQSIQNHDYPPNDIPFSQYQFVHEFVQQYDNPNSHPNPHSNNPIHTQLTPSYFYHTAISFPDNDIPHPQDHDYHQNPSLAHAYNTPYDQHPHQNQESHTINTSYQQMIPKSSTHPNHKSQLNKKHG